MGYRLGWKYYLFIHPEVKTPKRQGKIVQQFLCCKSSLLSANRSGSQAHDQCEQG